MRPDDSATTAPSEPTFVAREDPSDPLLDVAEVARMTGLAVGTLYTYRTHRRAGRRLGPAFVVTGSGRVRYRRSDVLAYLSVRAGA
ncbi:MAG: helix-turn-helix domain-containing protein [Bacteroidota bacterium]